MYLQHEVKTIQDGELTQCFIELNLQSSVIFHNSDFRDTTEFKNVIGAEMKLY